MSPTHDDAGIYRDPGSTSANRNRVSFTSTLSEEKENGEAVYPRTKLSPEVRYKGSAASSGRGSPARGFRSAPFPQEDSGDTGPGMSRERPTSSAPQAAAGSGGAESWKRAAEVTSQLKARIEQMKVRISRSDDGKGRCCIIESNQEHAGKAGFCSTMTVDIGERKKEEAAE